MLRLSTETRTLDRMHACSCFHVTAHRDIGFQIDSLAMSTAIGIVGDPDFGDGMALEMKTGQTLKLTINKSITRASAMKTVERLFMKDKSVAEPLEARSANFIPLPKRRGGCIWTKRVNKIHPVLVTGVSAVIMATPQAIRDLNSVSEFVGAEAQ